VSDFEKPIRKVWRRLRFQRFLTASVWTLGAAMLLVAGVIAVEKWAAQPIPGAAWVPFAVAAGAGLLLATLIALVTGPSRLDAAIAIDRAFHLNERLGTVLSLPPEQLETPAGRALVADTKRQLERIDVASRFGPRLPKTVWVPIVPALLALGLFVLPEFSKNQARAREPIASEETEAIQEQADALKKRIAQARKKLEEAESAESSKLMIEIQKAAEELAKAPPAEKEQALVKLNELTDALKQRREQIGDSDGIRRKLQNLQRSAADGPADRFARDLAKGDYEKAAEEARKLKEKLLSGEMSEAEKQKLKEQLSEMRKQLQEMANLEERKKQLKEARDSGKISQEQYEQQIARLNDQEEDLKKLSEMANKLAEAEQSLSQGDMKRAAEALGMTQEQLETMASELAELETLDAAMADLQMAKDGMTGGDGLNKMGERLGGMNAFGQGMSMNPGQGLGRGRGEGDRPIAEDDTSTFQTRVRQQLGRGKAIQEGFGPPSAQTIGESIIEAQEALDANSTDNAEATTNQRVPKFIEEHVQSYLDSFRRDD